MMRETKLAGFATSNVSGRNWLAAGTVLLLLAVVSSIPASGQASAVISGQVISLTGIPQPFAAVRICAQGATGIPCTPLASIYADPGLTVPLSNPTAANQYGFFSAFVGSTNSFYQVQTTYGTITYPYWANGGGGGSSANITNQIANYLPLASGPSALNAPSHIYESGGVDTVSQPLTGTSASFSGAVAAGTVNASGPGSFGSETVSPLSLTPNGGSNAAGCQTASALGFKLNGTDESGSFLTLVQTWFDAGTGGCLFIDNNKTLRVDSQVTFPPSATFASPPASPTTGLTRLFTDASADGTCSGGGSETAQCKWSGSAWVNSTPFQMPAFRFTGTAPSIATADVVPATFSGGSRLDLRFNGDRIIVASQNTFEIDHLLVLNGGTNCGTFIFSTLASVQLHDTAFSGSSSNMNIGACEDVWRAGGTNTPPGLNGSLDDYFNGYASKVSQVFGQYIRRLVYGRVAFNSIPIVHNVVWSGSGSNLTTPITAATNATAAILTSNGHGFSVNTLSGLYQFNINLKGFTGNWTPCNGFFLATIGTGNNFSIPCNSTSFGALTGSPAYYTGAAIEINGAGVTSGPQAGNTISNNLIETTFYTYGVRLATAQQNEVKNNSCWDSNLYTIACARFESDAVSNISQGAFVAGTPPTNDVNGSNTPLIINTKGTNNCVGIGTSWCDGLDARVVISNQAPGDDYLLFKSSTSPNGARYGTDANGNAYVWNRDNFNVYFGTNGTTYGSLIPGNLWDIHAGITLQTDGPLVSYGSVQIQDSGVCTMASGACTALPLSGTYTSGPTCFANWTGAGTLTGLIKIGTSATTVTLQSTINTDTAQLFWVCFGKHP